MEKSPGCRTGFATNSTGACARGEKARGLVDWLNSLPAVRTVVKAQFEGRDIREQNVSEWRKGGYRDWLAQRVALEQGRELCEEVAELGRKCKAPVTDRLAAYLSAHYAVAMKRAVRPAAGGSVDLKTLRALCGDVVALRRADQDAQWLRLERKRLKLEQEHSIAKWKKKMQLELDDLLMFLGRSKSEVKAVFSDYFNEWFKQAVRCGEEPEEHPKESIGPSPDDAVMAFGPAPGKSQPLRPNPGNLEAYRN